MSYGEFAFYYDRLMNEANYEELADYIINLFTKYSNEVPENLLDVGCGTATLDVFLCKKGIQVIGCDSSEEMLTVAREKFFEYPELDSFFLQQDMDKIDLLHLVEGVISTFDTINHVTDINVLRNVFKRIHLFLKPNGLFVFDVNTEYKHKYTLSNNSFVFDTEDVYCVWQNRYVESENCTEIDIDLFVPDDENYYERYSESFKERAYTDNELKEIIESTGFEIIDILGDRSFSKPNNNENRLFYVVKRKD